MRTLLFSLALLAQTVYAQPAADDHRNMMEQLGIRSLRPGPSGNEQAPNHANYDEALANPFPKLPEVLTLTNGRKVTSEDNWWKLRRPEIVEDFEQIGMTASGKVQKAKLRVHAIEAFALGNQTQGVTP